MGSARSKAAPCVVTRDGTDVDKTRGFVLANCRSVSERKSASLPLVPIFGFASAWPERHARPPAGPRRGLAAHRTACRGRFMRRASSLVGLPFDLTPGGLMADSGGFVLPMHRRVGSRVGRSSRIDTKDRKAGRRGRMSLNRRRFVTLVFVLAAVATLRIVAYLSLWYPGDETIRATSESWLKLMFSRSGVSFGTGRAIKFATDVRIDAGDAILTTKPGSVVQGKISQRPRWEKGKDLNVTAVAEIHLRDALEKNCFFRVRDDAPVVTLWDDGVVHEYELNGGVAKASDFGGGTAGDGSRGHDSPQTRLNVESLACSHFRCMSYASWSRLSEGRTPTPPPVTKDSQSGNVLLINSATTLKMLSEYHRPLLNHQAYAESHGYGYVLALVKPSDLQGMFGPFPNPNPGTLFYLC